MMRALLFFLLGMILGACTSAAPAPAMVPGAAHPGHEDEAANLEPKVVALVARDELGGAHAYCSGVWVSESTILTANHCTGQNGLGAVLEYVVRGDVFGAGEARERGAIGGHAAVLYARDEAHDLALVRALVPPPHATAYVTLETVRPGMFVQTMGQPLGLWWSYSSGDVAALRVMDGAVEGMKDVLFVQTTAPISPGNSGGALFDAYGQIVGICHASIRKGQGLNLFVHYTYVDAFLRAQGGTL